MKNLKEFLAKNGLSGVSDLGFGKGPESDWKTIVALAISFCFIATAFNVWVFTKIKTVENGANQNGQNTESALDINRIRNTVQYYQNKEAELEKIKSGEIPVIVDPSL